jgi:hypothetical protein
MNETGRPTAPGEPHWSAESSTGHDVLGLDASDSDSSTAPPSTSATSGRPSTQGSPPMTLTDTLNRFRDRTDADSAAL